MKRQVNPFDYAGDICKALPGGILLTTKRGEEVNTMTIGWGHIGIEWSIPIFVVYVRESRYTKQLLEENGEFTINVPVGEIDKSILGVCGTTLRPRQKDDGSVEFYQAMGLSLTFDHRVVDGAPAARFLKALADKLEKFNLILAL